MRTIIGSIVLVVLTGCGSTEPRQISEGSVTEPLIVASPGVVPLPMGTLEASESATSIKESYKASFSKEKQERAQVLRTAKGPRGTR